MSNIFLKRFSLLLVVSLCCAGLIFAGQAKGQNFSADSTRCPGAVAGQLCFGPNH